MKSFNLEIRASTFGSIITWKVYLEDSTDDSKLILGWFPSEDGYLFRKFSSYSIDDNTLEVFAGCQGIKGGKLIVEVLINGLSQQEKVTAKVEDKKYAFKSYAL